MSDIITVAQAIALLLNADNILLICHKNPDGDTLGSAAALQHALQALERHVAVLCADEIPAQYAYMCITPFTGQFVPQLTVAIDVAGVQLFGDEVGEYARNIDLCIDHHASNSHYANSLLLEAEASATAEIIFSMLCEMGTAITPLMANCLYTGISTDTGCFIFANTTGNAHYVAGKLIQLGADIKHLNALLFESKSQGRMEIERDALNSLTYHFGGRCAMICLSQNMICRAGVGMDELESISAIPRKIMGVEVGVTLRQQPSGSYKVSIRTGEEVSASAIAKRLGGGGHVRAAGCEIIGSQENATAAVLAEVEKELCKES